MKKAPTILQEDTLVGIMLRMLVFFSVSAGLMLGVKSSHNFLDAEDGYFLSSTSIAAPPIYSVGLDCQEAGAIESEEKEEKERESEDENPDHWLGTRANSVVPISISGQSPNYEDQSNTFKKQRRYILFHCLKSELA